MLSRVAESIYWMSRYMERAENVARIVDVNLQLLLDQPGGTSAQWAPLVAITGDDELFKERYGSASRKSVIQFLTFDADYPSSILSCLRAARQNARSIREIISSEMWEQVNKSFLMVSEAAASGTALDSPYDFFTAVKDASHLFVGVTYLTMTHNEAWHFGRLGRLLERADKTSRLVDVKYFLLLPEVSDVNSTYDDIQWGALLKSASALEMYRKAHGRILPQTVIEFLLLDRRFPRSWVYCLLKARKSLHAITQNPFDAPRTSAEEQLGQLIAEVEGWSIRDIVQDGVHQRLDAAQSRLNGVGDAIYETFFAPRPLPEPSEPPASSPPPSQQQRQSSG